MVVDGSTTQRPAERTTTLRVTDELDLATLPALRARVDRALLDRPSYLVVDLSDCAFTGVDAVQALAVLSQQAQAQGTELVLVGLRRVVHRVIDLVGLQDRLHCRLASRSTS